MNNLITNDIPWVGIITVITVLAALLIILITIKRRRQRPLEMDEMGGHEFEYYCAELLEMNGFIDVEVTKGSGDFGADILCEKDGVTYAIQCKCYDKVVGVHAVSEVYAAKDYYDCMVGAVMSNQYFTEPAVRMAKKLNIILFDRDYLQLMKEP